MKSIKPGRGPSFIDGIVSICAGVFGLIWSIIAVRIGAGPFALFGVVFIIISIVNAVYSFKNATGKNRYSAFDITDGNEEPDPLNERFGTQRTNDEEGHKTGKYCPYCGSKIENDYKFCNDCGKKLP